MTDMRAQVRAKVEGLERRDVVQIHVESIWVGFGKYKERRN